MTLAHPISAFTLGSVIPVKHCAKGALFVSGKTNPVPSGGTWTPSDKAVGEAVTSRMLWWTVGIAAVAGLVWYGSKGGVSGNPRCRLDVKQHPDGSWGVAQNGRMFPRKFERKSDAIAWRGGMGNECVPGYDANPPLHGHWESATWEKAYREALREGFKPREAEEYALEVLQAAKDDRANALGGALGTPDEYANPLPPPPERLTPDIIVEGQMPTKAEYVASLRILQEIDRTPGGIEAYRVAAFSDVEGRAWTAMARAGLLQWIGPKGAQNAGLSDYGKLYLRQRSAKANPNYSARRDALEKILGNAGWSFKLADYELRADGAARGYNGMLYLLSADDGGSFHSPKDPVHVGVYALNAAKDEWIEVGEQTFDDLRSALRGWQNVKISSHDNPGRAQTRLDAVKRNTFSGNPDSSAPYTLEDVNTLTGTRTHRKATKYETLNDAMQRAREKASQMRKFAEVNILDRSGNHIMTFVGVK